MDTWVGKSKNRCAGKVAVVTGASAGCGASISLMLVQQGMTVIAIARRVELIKDLQNQLTSAPGKLVPIQGDVSKEEDIVRIFDYVKKNYKTIHILVNNAGFMKVGKLIDGDAADWKSILDVNVLGLTSCSQKAIKLMRDSGVDDGHIININSMAGHRIPPSDNPVFNIYPPSKFAVTAISETLRQELRSIKSKIRVTNLSPGFIKTDFQRVAVQQDPVMQKQFEHYIANIPGLVADDVRDAVMFIISSPTHVQVHELIIGSV